MTRDLRRRGEFAMKEQARADHSTLDDKARTNPRGEGQCPGGGRLPNWLGDSGVLSVIEVSLQPF